MRRDHNRISSHKIHFVMNVATVFKYLYLKKLSLSIRNDHATWKILSPSCASMNSLKESQNILCPSYLCKRSSRSHNSVQYSRIKVVTSGLTIDISDQKLGFDIVKKYILDVREIF